ncbi:MAG: tetratricopeptide repeat protein [Pseudomonadota bacterium]
MSRTAIITQLIVYLAFATLMFFWGSYVLAKQTDTRGGSSQIKSECSQLEEINPVAGQVFQKAESLYEAALNIFHGPCDVDHYKLGINLLELAAGRGYIKASYLLGEIFYAGQIFPTNFDKSKHYYLQAAQKGHLAAQHELGVIMLKEATNEDQQYEALRWLGIAAYQEDGLSAYLLGIIHQTGLHGIEKNPCLALDWHEQATEMGFSDTAGFYDKLSAAAHQYCN